MREPKRRVRADITEGVGPMEDTNEQELANAIGEERHFAERGERKDNLPSAKAKAESGIISEQASEKRTIGEQTGDGNNMRGSALDERAIEGRKTKIKKRKAPRRGGRAATAAYCATLTTCLALGATAVFFSFRGDGIGALDKEGVIFEENGAEESYPSAENKGQDTADKLSAEAIYALGADSAVCVCAVYSDGARCFSGSSVLERGYFITLWSKVDGASSVWIRSSDGAKQEASVIAYDKSVDLALLYAEGLDTEPISAGASIEMIGERVYGVGTVDEDGATLPSSLYSAEVAYCKRSVSIDSGKTQRVVKAIQISGFSDSALEGCPIFNGRGEPVAMVICVEDSFALAFPIAEVLAVVEEMKGGGSPNVESLEALAYICPRLGVVCDADKEGLRIVSFEIEDGDASIKLRRGDVIVSVGDGRVTDNASLSAVLEKYRAGQSAEIFVKRDGQLLSFFVTLI